MIVPAMQQPDFKGDARCVRTNSVVVALYIHNALPLFFFLADRIAENAAFFVFEPFVRGAQLVFDSPRHKDGSRDLRVRVRPFFPCRRSLILEYADVLEARVLLQISYARDPNPQDTLNLLVAELRHA